jgi:hypothetical protein
MRDRHQAPAAAVSAPAAITGRVPVRANSREEIPAATVMPAVTGR